MPPGAQTVCPRCKSALPARGARPNACHGEARCDACGTVFNVPRLAAPGSGVAARARALFPKRGAGRSPPGRGGPSQPSARPPEARAGRAGERGVDHYLSRRSGLLSGFWWLAAALALVLLLGWQVRNPVLEKYAQHADYRAFLRVSCLLFNCRLEAKKDLLRLSLIHTAIDRHPFEPGALRATLKLLNQATFAQLYPDFQITFTDRNGRVVGRRTFAPDLYLESGRPNRLDSGELGVVRFDFARPHKKVAGFEVNIVAGPAG